MVQHGEYTSGALWYSKVQPAEVAEVVDGAGDTDLALSKGGAVTVGWATGLMYCTLSHDDVIHQRHAGVVNHVPTLRLGQVR